MTFGYIDESGAPGVAACSRDYLLVSLVVFATEEAEEKSIARIEKLRAELWLPEDYEFHCSSNSTRPQMAFLQLLAKLEFGFLTIAIRKNGMRKTASYTRMSRLVVEEVRKRFSQMRIEMDSNPVLYAELRKAIRELKLKNIKIRERNSRSSRLLQAADYVANVCAKKAKNTPKAREWYGYIEKKAIAFIKIEE